MIATTKKKKTANDLIYPYYGFGDAYLAGVFTGSEFEMATILHVFVTFFCGYGVGCFCVGLT